MWAPEFNKLSLSCFLQMMLRSFRSHWMSIIFLPRFMLLASLPTAFRVPYRPITFQLISFTSLVTGRWTTNSQLVHELTWLSKTRISYLQPLVMLVSIRSSTLDFITCLSTMSGDYWTVSFVMINTCRNSPSSQLLLICFN